MVPHILIEIYYIIQKFVSKLPNLLERRVPKYMNLRTEYQRQISHKFLNALKMDDIIDYRA